MIKDKLFENTNILLLSCDKNFRNMADMFLIMLGSEFSIHISLMHNQCSLLKIKFIYNLHWQIYLAEHIQTYVHIL